MYLESSKYQISVWGGGGKKGKGENEREGI